MSAATYIARTAADPLVWGRNDCACWAASLVAEATGRDPLADLRGTYGTPFAARMIVMRAGGLLTMVRRRMAWLPADPHVDRDGVCIARVGGVAICGIVSGGRLFLKSDPGVLVPEDYKIFDHWTLD